MLRPAIVIFALVSLVVSACGLVGAPAPNTYDVSVDMKASGLNLATTAYFPSEVTAHPGDTVRFTSVDRGEPHTVTFGALIDKLAPVLEKLPPGAPEPADAAKAPTLIAGEPPQLFVPQSAAQPCFLASGDPPAKDACAKATQPDFDGTQAFYSSGYLPDAAVFTVKLSTSTKPGSYRFMCLLHRGAMTGTVTVVEGSKSAPAPATIKSNGDALLQKMVTGLKPATDGAFNLSGDKAVAGVGVQAVPNGFATIFAPKQAQIPVGGSVTWTVFGPHTISFNNPQDAVGALVKAPDGSWALNGKALAPSGWPGAPPPPAAAPGAPPPSAPIPVDAGRWDGKGFHSSGFILSFPPVLFSYKLTFTQAGTYKVVCLIHPDMEGTVKVGN